MPPTLKSGIVVIGLKAQSKTEGGNEERGNTSRLKECGGKGGSGLCSSTVNLLFNYGGRAFTEASSLYPVEYRKPVRYHPPTHHYQLNIL